MVVIRLARTGSKKAPFYHVVATDKRNSRDGRFIERVGYFNPIARGQAEHLKLNLERINYWCEHGAQASQRVSNLIKAYKKADGKFEAGTTIAELKKAQADQSQKLAKKKLEAEKAQANAEQQKAAEKTPAKTEEKTETAADSDTKAE